MGLANQERFNKIPAANFRVQLSCGHWIKTRNHPLDKRTKYGCTLGTGCGYQLNWLVWEDSNSPEIRRENL